MFWKKKELDIQFVDKTGLAFEHTPIQRACDVKPKYFLKQKEENGRLMFSNCPGMFDLYRVGYIIPAWCDIFIKANKAGVVTVVKSGRGNPGFDNARPMDHALINGLVEFENVAPNANHLGSPWAVFTRNKLTCWVGPATYHNDLSKDIIILPGLIDYNDFHSMNLIFAARRECEVHIKAGDPLIQVIPFGTPTEIRGGYGPADELQKQMLSNQIHTTEKQYYRRRKMQSKYFSLDGL